MRAKTLLVAEDDHSIRELIRTRLQLSGYEVLVARTGAEAITRVRNFLVDGVVLDINMPEVDGFGVLKAIQSTQRISRLPVLMLTARHAEQDVRRALVLGARDYLTKPFTEQQLVAGVARLLRTPFVSPRGGEASAERPVGGPIQAGLPGGPPRGGADRRLPPSSA